MFKGLCKSVFTAIIFALLFCACTGAAPETPVPESAAPEEETNASAASANTASAGGERAVAFINGVLIDGTGAEPVSNAEVIVRDGRIEKAGAYSEADIPADAVVYDLKGAAVLPGFINAHVHRSYDQENLKNWVNAGVTTVRDEAPMTGGDFLEERDTLNKDPKNTTIVSATPIITAPGGYGAAQYESSEDAREMVLGYIDKNVDIIKTSVEDDLQGRRWSLPTYEEFESVVKTAHSRNKKVSVHISHSRHLQWAVNAGVDDIAHMVVEPLEPDIIEKLVMEDIYWVPTLELWKGVSEMHSLDWDRIAIDNVSKYYKAGGKIALGTDFSGYTCSFDKGFPITEVTLMKEAGMSNMDIIIAGTRNAAHVCDRDKELGTVEAGKKADLLIVKGDPIADINALTDVKAVMHGGVMVKGTVDEKDRGK